MSRLFCIFISSKKFIHIITAVNNLNYCALVTNHQHSMTGLSSPVIKLINIITPFHQLSLSGMSLAHRTVHITPNPRPHPNNNSLPGPNRCVEHMINMKMLQPCMSH